MKKIERVEYFDAAPRGKGWLHTLRLRVGELVEVAGVVYRYSVERDGRDHVLTPVDK